MKKIQYKNKTIAYTVCKAKVKNLYISIQNGEVVVKAPWYVTSNQIQEVIEEKRRWILEKIEEYQNSPRKAKAYIDGEKYQILGKNYYLNIYFQDINNAKLKVENGMINIVLPIDYAERDNTELIKKMIDKMYNMIAKKEVDITMKKLTKLVGLAPDGYRVRKVKSEWGSCSSNKKITINQDLIMYSRHALEYIIIHELCHLKHMNHSKRFWNMVKSFMPDYKEAEKELKK